MGEMPGRQGRWRWRRALLAPEPRSEDGLGAVQEGGLQIMARGTCAAQGVPGNVPESRGGGHEIREISWPRP